MLIDPVPVSFIAAHVAAADVLAFLQLLYVVQAPGHRTLLPPEAATAKRIRLNTCKQVFPTQLSTQKTKHHSGHHKWGLGYTTGHKHCHCP